MEVLVQFIVSATNVACAIIVLTKLIPDEGLAKGIFGMICGLYTFVWGWRNKDLHGLETVMNVWACAMLAQIVTPLLLR